MNQTLIISDKNSKSIKIKQQIKQILKKNILKKNNLIIVIGGDGFMLKTLKKNKKNNKLFYGINSGDYGFLMNKFSKKKLITNIIKSKMISISPLEMKVFYNNKVKKSIAINEVSILRQSRQAANLSIKNNSKYIMQKLVSDGVLVSTPAGSTAYNLSVHGPILSLNSNKLGITPISPFRPRRWKGKAVGNSNTINIINLDANKRPIAAVADNIEVRDIKSAKIRINKNIRFSLLYDKNRSLEQRIKLEQLKKNLKNKR